MKEQLILFDTAKLAKEKGFDWEPTYIYNLSENPPILNLYGEVVVGDFELYAPTKSLLQEWLWETHSIWVQSTPLFSSNECIGISVIISSWKFPFISIEYDGFDVYEGLEKGLQEALNNLIMVQTIEVALSSDEFTAIQKWLDTQSKEDWSGNEHIYDSLISKFKI